MRPHDQDTPRHLRQDHETNTVEDAARFERERADARAVWVNGQPRDPDEIPGRDEL